MTHAPGYNPLRWKCDESGCYNTKHRPKIEMFAECLPGKIAFTDVDASVEVNGSFLFLEFKSGGPREIPMGQRIYFTRLTQLSPKITVVVVCADAETMGVTAACVISKGKMGEWEPLDIGMLKNRIRAWAEKVKKP
jgi:hypothetical protein